jgi:hypothetical protein
LKQCHNIAKAAQEQGKSQGDLLFKTSNMIQTESSSEQDSTEVISSISSDDTLIVVKKEANTLDNMLSSSTDTEASSDVKPISYLTDVKSAANNDDSNALQLVS